MDTHLLLMHKEREEGVPVRLETTFYNSIRHYRFRLSPFSLSVFRTWRKLSYYV